jgi:hypothetical protein
MKRLLVACLIDRGKLLRVWAKYYIFERFAIVTNCIMNADAGTKAWGQSSSSRLHKLTGEQPCTADKPHSDLAPVQRLP